jgi:hypothetical protein
MTAHTEIKPVKKSFFAQLKFPSAYTILFMLIAFVF